MFGLGKAWTVWIVCSSLCKLATIHAWMTTDSRSALDYKLYWQANKYHTALEYTKQLSESNPPSGRTGFSTLSIHCGLSFRMSLCLLMHCRKKSRLKLSELYLGLKACHNLLWQEPALALHPWRLPQFLHSTFHSLKRRLDEQCSLGLSNGDPQRAILLCNCLPDQDLGTVLWPKCALIWRIDNILISQAMIAAPVVWHSNAKKLAKLERDHSSESCQVRFSALRTSLSSHRSSHLFCLAHQSPPPHGQIRHASRSAAEVPSPAWWRTVRCWNSFHCWPC